MRDATNVSQSNATGTVFGPAGTTSADGSAAVPVTAAGRSSGISTAPGI